MKTDLTRTSAGIVLFFLFHAALHADSLWYRETGVSQVSSLMSGVRVRESPDLNSRVLSSLEEGETVTFLGQISEATFSAVLQGKKYEAPFVRVQKQDGTEGWVYAAALTADFQLSPFYLEKLGPLKIGMTVSDVIRILGEPESKGQASVWAADGMIHQEWNYRSKGISLNIAGEEELSEVISIDITSPCNYQTSKKIGIGSSFEAVYRAYLGFLADPKVKSGESIMVGSEYGGIIIRFKNAQVESIFFGAAAE